MCTRASGPVYVSSAYNAASYDVFWTGVGMKNQWFWLLKRLKVYYQQEEEKKKE